MGQITIFYCDMHEGDTGVHATHRGFELEFDGNPAEIDLCDTHYEELRYAVAPYVMAARRVKAAAALAELAPKAGPPERKPARIDPEQAKHIRAWCADNGIELSTRGAIPKHALEAYHARDIATSRRTETSEAQFCGTLEEYRQQALAWLMQRGEYVSQTGPTRPQLARYTKKTGWRPPAAPEAAG